MYIIEQSKSHRKKPEDDNINNVKEFDKSRMEEMWGVENTTFKLVSVHIIIEKIRVCRAKVIEKQFWCYIQNLVSGTKLWR